MGTRKCKSPTHYRDRHYNYPREDAVLILNPLEDKSAIWLPDILRPDTLAKLK